MDIKFSCNNAACKQKIAVEPSMAGRAFRCPKCGTSQLVPGERVVPPSVPLPAKEAESALDGRIEKTLLPAAENNPYSFGGRSRRLLCGWGVGLAIVGLLLGAMQVSIWARLPRNFNAMQKEVSAVGEFRKIPFANRGGSELMYARNLKTNLGTFLVDLGSLQQSRPRPRGVRGSFGAASFNLFGWSPDDKYMVFSWTLIPDHQDKQMGLCDGNTGALRISFATPGSPRKAIWLTTNTMVFIDSSYTLYIYNLNRTPDLGKFGKQGLMKLRKLGDVPNYYDEGIFSLARRSDSSIAFVDKGNVWMMDIPGDQAGQLTQFNGKVLEWLDYSPEKDQYLFCLTDKSGPRFRRLYRFDPNAASKDELMQCSRHDNIFKGQWVLDGKGLAYVDNKGSQNCLTIDTADRRLRTNLFNEGHMRSFSVAPNGKSVYAIASIDDGPMGIWEYDIVSQKLRNVAPAMEKPFAVSQITTPVKTSAGGMGYFFLPPAHLDKQKKYPLVIDATRDSRWDAGPEIIANSGIFYASVNRDGLSTFFAFNTSPKDMMALYKEMLKNPNVDPHRVYLAGTSAGSAGVTQLVDEDPTLWRGAAFLSPGTFPQIPSTSTNFPSMYISVYSDDGVGGKSLVEKFASEACRGRISIRLDYHQGNGHILETTESIKERWAGLARFILLNQ